MIWTPSIIIVVAVIGAVDLSSLATAQRFTSRALCERAVHTFVGAALLVYPKLQVSSARCVEVK